MDTIFNIATWLSRIGSYGLVLATAWGVLAIMVKDVRRAFGNYLTLLSYLLGLALWLLSAVIVHDIWGWTGFIIGLCLGGIGVVPLSLLAAATHGQWNLLGHLSLSLLVLIACRYGGIVLVAKDEERRTKDAERVEELERRVKALEYDRYAATEFEHD